jgi:glutamate racemase
VNELASAPLGVFDSGLGGLTVVRALRAQMPHESFIYLGDTARVPYGTRSHHTVTRYALGCARVLMKHKVKALIVACGTVSAVALDALRVELDVPVIGVIEPSAQLAVKLAQGQRIGVLGTNGTVASGAYPRAVAALSTRSEVVAQAAPLWVPLAEEGWLEGDVPRLAAERYLQPLLAAKVKVVILGCTHYPLLIPVIQEVANRLSGEQIPVIDTGVAVAQAVELFLADRQRQALATAPGSLRAYVTDMPASFRDVAERFLGSPLAHVEQIDL